jgi:hypothetical protein
VAYLATGHLTEDGFHLLIGHCGRTGDIEQPFAASTVDQQGGRGGRAVVTGDVSAIGAPTGWSTRSAPVNDG